MKKISSLLLLPLLLFGNNAFFEHTQKKFEHLKTLATQSKLMYTPSKPILNFCQNAQDFSLIFEHELFLSQNGKTFFVEQQVEDVCLYKNHFVFLKDEKTYIYNDGFEEIVFEQEVKKAFLSKYFPNHTIEQKSTYFLIFKDPNFETLYQLDFFNKGLEKHCWIGSIDELCFFLKDKEAIVVPLTKERPFFSKPFVPIPNHLFERQMVEKKVHMHFDPPTDAYFYFFPQFNVQLQHHLLHTRKKTLETFFETHFAPAPSLLPKRLSKELSFTEKTLLPIQDASTFLSYEIIKSFCVIANVSSLLLEKEPFVITNTLGFKKTSLPFFKKPSFSKIDLFSFWQTVCVCLILGIEHHFEELVHFLKTEDSVQLKLDITQPLQFKFEKKPNEDPFFSNKHFLQKSILFYKLGARKMPFSVLNALNEWIEHLSIEALIKAITPFKVRVPKTNAIEPFFSKRDLDFFKSNFFKVKQALYVAKVNKKRMTLLEFAKIIQSSLD
jgi:hypothetical protein